MYVIILRMNSHQAAYEAGVPPVGLCYENNEPFLCMTKTGAESKLRELTRDFPNVEGQYEIHKLEKI